MLSINTKISKPLENSRLLFYIISNTVFTAQFIVSLVQHEDDKAFIINIGTVYCCRYNLYTLCIPSPGVAQSICTAETKSLYSCVDI